MTATDDTAARIAAVVRTHDGYGYAERGWQCTCGHRWPDERPHQARGTHAAHVAAVLVEAGIGVVAQAACALTTHADPEEHARIYNEGYEAAMAQHLAEDPSAADEWLAGVVAQAKAEALREAAGAVRQVRENGLPEGVTSHPTAEHFEDWLRARAAREAGAHA